jgi:hypothetical protein
MAAASRPGMGWATPASVQRAAAPRSQRREPCLDDRTRCRSPAGRDRPRQPIARPGVSERSTPPQQRWSTGWARADPVDSGRCRYRCLGRALDVPWTRPARPAPLHRCWPAEPGATRRHSRRNRSCPGSAERACVSPGSAARSCSPQPAPSCPRWTAARARSTSRPGSAGQGPRSPTGTRPPCPGARASSRPR